MINNPTPTRAEVNDIANAVLQGADCLMLSDETIIGKYPVAAVKFLARAAAEAERFAIHDQEVLGRHKVTSVSNGIAYAAANLADQYKTDAIIIPTQTGRSAKMISTLRPRTKIIALATNKKVRMMLSSLLWREEQVPEEILHLGGDA